MADKRIEDFATLEEAQDDDLLLVSSESETYTMKFKTFKELVAGLANAPVANAAPRTQNADFYVASGNNLPTVKVAVAFPYAHPTGKGRQIIFIPSRQNLTATPTLSLNNGQAIPIKTRASSNQGTDDTKPDAAVSIPVGCLMRGVPYLLTFCGKCWLIDSMIGSSSGGGGGSHYTINGQEADLNGDFHLSVEDLPGVQEERLVYSYDEITLTNIIHAIEDTSLPIQVYYDTGEYCSDPEENEYPYQGVAFLRLKSHHLNNNGFMVVIFEDDVELCDQSGVVKKTVRITISPGAHPGDPDVKTVTITDPASSGVGGAPHVHIFTLSDVTTTEIAALTEDTDNALFLAYNVANYTPDPEAVPVEYPYASTLLLLPLAGYSVGSGRKAVFEQDADLWTNGATVRKTVRVTVQSGASAGDPDVKTVEILDVDIFAIKIDETANPITCDKSGADILSAVENSAIIKLVLSNGRELLPNVNKLVTAGSNTFRQLAFSDIQRELTYSIIVNTATGIMNTIRADAMSISVPGAITFSGTSYEGQTLKKLLEDMAAAVDQLLGGAS